MLTSSSPPSQTYKREFPFGSGGGGEDVYMDSENSYSALAASASTAQAMKRVRMLDLPEHHQFHPQRKRSLAVATRSPSLDLLDQVKEEARNQIRMYSSAVDNLRQAVEATNADREKLLHDNRILKTGVLKLKSNNDLLQQRAEAAEAQANHLAQRNRMLESAIVALNASQRVPYGGCGGKPSDDFHDRHVF
ncbi:hypothetical protein BASA81_000885 [Batrachochytrium salamandrivorans]|nr:hypothetical protein BASA81_000885 [Batrachochytrium salamandrivorans]